MNHAQVKALDSAYYMNTFGERLPIMPVKGEGVFLYDDEGKKYTDFLAGIAVSALGYNYPALVEAIKNQAQKICHISNYFYIEEQAVLAKMLVENTCADKVFFANTGAEANEGAIKLARAYHYRKGAKRYGIVSANNSFHGRTLATVTATAQEKYQKPYAPLPTGFSYAPFGDIEALKAQIDDTTAAVILEPIQGEGGVVDGGEAYFKAVRELCDQTDTLLIFDEVQTGMGRTGTLFAYENYGIEPDIFTSAKALGGGLPIGAILAKEFCCAFMPGDHGTTFGGNALCCAAGIAVMDTLTKNGFLDDVAKKGEYFKAKLKKLAHTCIKEVRGRGLIIGAELDATKLAKDVQLSMLEKGFIIGIAGNNTLRFVPPLIISMEDIDALVNALDEVLA